jgi:nucleoside-diphosphate-sugar epimerase
VDWVYVDDVVEGMIAAAETSGLEGATIDLGSGTLVTIREVVTRIVALTGSQFEPRFGIHPDRPSEVVRIADVVSAQTLLGWRPKTPLEEGLRKTIDWYRNEIANGREPGGLFSRQEHESIKTAS